MVALSDASSTLVLTIMSTPTLRVTTHTVATAILLTVLSASAALAGDVVHLSVGASGQVENLVKDGPAVALGNGTPGTTTAPSITIDTVSGQGPVVKLDVGQVLRFDDASFFDFTADKAFTFFARILVDKQSPEGSAYLLNHWAFMKEDRSIAIRLIAQGGQVRPQVIIRQSDDVSHATIEPTDVRWPVGEWTNFAVVADGTMLSFWVNGVSSTSSFEIPAMRSSMLPVFIGGNGGFFPSDKGLAMQIKNLRILNKAADEAWIKAESASK